MSLLSCKLYMYRHRPKRRLTSAGGDREGSRCTGVGRSGRNLFSRQVFPTSSQSIQRASYTRRERNHCIASLCMLAPRDTYSFIHINFQVLSRDIRALHKRLGHSQQEGLYHVLLENVDVSYEVEDDRVVLRGAVLGGTGGRVQMSASSTV